MKELSAFAFEGMNRWLAGHGYLPFLPEWLFQLLWMLLLSFVVGLFIVAPLAGFTVYVERRVAGRMQSRIGPNRVGPEGLLQFVADATKLLLKEDIIPSQADRWLFRAAPYLVFLGVFLCFLVLPLGERLVLGNLDIGLFYIPAVSSVVVVGILLAGWSSNNKWSLFGSLRSGAQIVSYEIPVALVLLVPTLLSGSLNLGEIVHQQAGGFWHWHLFRGFGLAALAFVIYLVAALAEANRTPFDLPEAESELVAGYATEYSGIRFAIFFLAEYANLLVIALLASLLFLGGWNLSAVDVVPAALALYFLFIIALKSLDYLFRLLKRLTRPGPKHLAVLLNDLGTRDFGRPLHAALILAAVALSGWAYLRYGDRELVQAAFLLAKSYAIVFVIIWLRWTLPRFRVDQMMTFCWKVLVPVSMLLLLGTAAAMLV